MGKFRLFNIALSLLLLCSHATADWTQPPLPADVAMNKEVARGEPAHGLILTIRLESGEELPFLVDTGSPITFLDKSLVSKLGKRLGSVPMLTYRATQQAGLYAAPKLYLGNVPLATAECVGTMDLRYATGYSHRRVMGILGLDCLCHYCIQLDFETLMVRFFDTNHLDKAELGKAFPLTLSDQGQGIKGIYHPGGDRIRFLSPYVHHIGLVPGSDTNLLIDTGDNNDGNVEKGVIKGHYLARLTHFLIRFRDLRLSECDWDGNHYTNLRVGTEPAVLGGSDVLGLRFLARHLVTLDFPEQTMYLKQTSIGPLINKKMRPNKSLQATRDGGFSSAVAVHVASRRF